MSTSDPLVSRGPTSTGPTTTTTTTGMAGGNENPPHPPTSTSSGSGPGQGQGQGPSTSSLSNTTPRSRSTVGLPGNSSIDSVQGQGQGQGQASTPGQSTNTTNQNPTNPTTSNPPPTTTSNSKTQPTANPNPNPIYPPEIPSTRPPIKPRLLITSDELNVLIYSYLCESSFPHTAYTFRSESKLDHSPLFSAFQPDRPGRFPGGVIDTAAAAAAAVATVGGGGGAGEKKDVDEPSAQVKGKGKGKGKEVDQSVVAAAGTEDKMDVDSGDVVEPTSTTTAVVDEEPTVGPSSTTTRKASGPTKPALKRKASDRGERERGTTTARSTPGPPNTTAGTTGARPVREDRMRAVPRGELIRHLYKGLMWDEVEKHAHFGWNDAPPCVTPFTLLSRHECTLAVPPPGELPVIPPILINRKTNTPIYSAILTPEERAAIRQQDAFPPAAEGSNLDRLERVLGQRESHVTYSRRIRAEEKQRLRDERVKEKLERRARREAEIIRAQEAAAARAETVDVEMEDVADIKPERVKIKEGKRRTTEDDNEVAMTNGHPGPSSAREKDKRERDRDKDRGRDKEKESAQPVVVSQATVLTTGGFGKKKKRVLSSDETDMPEPNGSVALARTKKREDSGRTTPTGVNGTGNRDKEKKPLIKKREEERGKSRDDDFVPKKRKLGNGDYDGKKDREGLGMGSAPGSSSKTNRIVSESTLTESDAETRKPAKKGARARRNSNASNATKSERSGERQDARSVSQTPVPTIGTGIKAIFAGHKNPLQPVERDGMLCWRGHTKKLNRVSWNPLNLSRLISCSQDGLCNIWDFADPPSTDDKQLRLLARVPIELTHKALETKKAVVDLAWNNDGNAFVTIDKDNVARSFVGDGELQGTGYRHEREITCVAWNPNGNYFATTNIDGQTCVWDISVVPIKLKNSWDHHAPNKAYHVDWLTNEIFATCSEDYTVAICSVNSPTSLKLLTKHKDRVLVCKFSLKARPEDKLPTGSDFPTGLRRLLASGSDDHTVRIWDVQALEDEGARVFADPRDAAKQPKELLVLEGHVDDIQLIQWCPRIQKDGKRLLVTMSMADPQSASADRHVIKMYDVNATDGKNCLYTITEHQEEIRALEFSPEGDMFMSCSEDGVLNVWHTETGRLKKRFSCPGVQICDAKWRPDGEQLALAMADATLRTIYVGDLKKRIA